MADLASDTELTPEEIAETEARNKRMESSARAEEAMREMRSRAFLEQAEADAKLGRIAREQKAELMEEAISHSTSNVGGLLIDSYELPGDRFVTCSMTFSGPIYSCDR